jgi:ferritin-like metal-binding protein YciE
MRAGFAISALMSLCPPERRFGSFADCLANASLLRCAGDFNPKERVMKNVKNLEEALVEQMRDLLGAERMLSKALPKMARKASTPELREAFEDHKRETDEQVQRLERAFEAMGKPARAKKCEAMDGLVEEGEEILKQDGEANVLDAMLIAAAQKIEHYEIASYGTICTWADQLGLSKAGELLKQNLAEEKEADEKLTQIAMEVNPDATEEASGGDGDEMEDQESEDEDEEEEDEEAA